MPLPVRLLSAVVVSYRSAALAVRCVSSLRADAARAGVPLEVVVVDNSAEPGERALLGALPDVRYLPLDTNAGYAGGLVRGASEAKGEVLLLANPDLVFAPGSLAPLLEALSIPGAGAAGPRFTWDEEGHWLLPPLWVPSLRRELAKALALSRLGLRSPLLADWRALALSHWEAREPTPVHGLVGALLAVPRGVWDRVGPFDARYPLYFEDTDWSVRAVRAGWKLLLVPRSRVVHDHGGSTGQESEASAARWVASEEMFRSLHLSLLGRTLGRVAAALLPPSSRPELPIARPPVRLEWREAGRALLELTTMPEGVPAAGRFVDGRSFDLTGPDWERLPAGDLFLRVTDRASGAVLARAAFRKETGSVTAPAPKPVS